MLSCTVATGGCCSIGNCGRLFLLFLHEIRYFDKSGDCQLTLLFNALEGIKAIYKSYNWYFTRNASCRHFTRGAFCVIVFKRKHYLLRPKDSRAVLTTKNASYRSTDIRSENLRKLTKNREANKEQQGKPNKTHNRNISMNLTHRGTVLHWMGLNIGHGNSGQKKGLHESWRPVFRETKTVVNFETNTP